MLHTLLVILYAAVGLAGFTAGVLRLPSKVSGPGRLRLCSWAVIAMFEVLIVAVAAHWIAST